jgi:exosortase/archaeosortase family protein
MTHRTTAIRSTFDRLPAAILVLGVTYALILPRTLLTDSVAAIAGPISTYLQQALGLPAVLSSGNILLGHQKISVEGESGGAVFLAVFIAVTLAVAVRMDRPLWEKCLLVLSTIPLGLIAVVIRLTGTCALVYAAGPELAQSDCHPWTMLTMCALALGLFGLEVKYLKHLLIEADPTSANRPIRTFPAAHPPNRRLPISSACAAS